MIELPEHRMPGMSSVVLCPGETNVNDHDSEFLIFLGSLICFTSSSGHSTVILCLLDFEEKTYTTITYL